MAMLYLYIRGLCGVIPWTRTERIGADIALARARRHGGHVPAHAAKFSLHRGQFEVTGDPGPFERREWRVEGRAIRIGDGTVAEHSKGLTLVRSDRDYPWQGLQWILSMLLVAPDCRPRRDVGVGAEGRVTTAIRLVDGTLQGSPPSRGKMGLWAINRVTTALSDTVLYTRDCPEGYVEFQFANLAVDGRRVGTIKLVPVDSENDIVVSLTNFPAVEHRHERGDLSHVSAVYDLFDNVPQDAPLPAFRGLIDRVSSPVETNDDPINCIHAIHIPFPPRPDPPIEQPGEFPTFVV
jgi:hypothetical protein